jgi:hypothetical protein
MVLDKLCRGLALTLLLVPFLTTVGVADDTAAANRTLIRAGQLLDIHSGKETANQTIVVTGERITEASPQAR